MKDIGLGDNFNKIDNTGSDSALKRRAKGGFNLDSWNLIFVLAGVLLISVIGMIVFGYKNEQVSADDVSPEAEAVDWEEAESQEVEASSEGSFNPEQLDQNNEAIAKAWEEEMAEDVKVVVDENGNEVLMNLNKSPANYGYVDDRQYIEPLNPEDVSPISGLPCDKKENKDRRPIAVMLSADKAVRPLSGIGEADMVFEMQVISGTITRLMPVFVCNSPKEIGSIRSARHDYISLAKGVDAMLAHWGGSHFALDYLKNRETVPDLDALKNPYGAFFRKSAIRMPHNGFASYNGLFEAARKMGYRLENKFEGYPHRAESKRESRGSAGHLYVGLPGICKVSYDYDPNTNSYLRYWNNIADTDKLTGKRLAPKNVVIVFAKSRQIEGQYNDVDIEGEGEMRAFIEGREFKGKWIKEKNDCVIGDDLVCVSGDRMRFVKDDGEELEFVPGQIWVEVLDPGQKVIWKN
ncbi:MAG: DUF3048 domain-containing protein [Candidatus Moranbacteria bacterium]|nr:DUF3048 domain-containing protein [Candidatus Moranbacteria bacterium]